MAMNIKTTIDNLRALDHCRGTPLPYLPAAQTSASTVTSCVCGCAQYSKILLALQSIHLRASANERLFVMMEVVGVHLES